MAKTKQEWLYQLRRCSSLKTLEKIIAKNQGTLTSDKIETFNSGTDNEQIVRQSTGFCLEVRKITPTKRAGNPTPALIPE